MLKNERIFENGPRLDVPICIQSFTRDCTEKNETDIFLHIPKMVAFKVKTQSRDQNNWSRAKTISKILLVL